MHKDFKITFIVRSIFFVLVVLLVCYCEGPKKAVAEKFEVQKGTNVAHWLSQSDRRGEEREQFFTKKDIQKIKLMGFDHIRLPIDEEQLWGYNGNRHEDAFSLMKKCINWCAESDLKIIVDLHILRSHHFNAAVKPLWTDVAEQEKFFDLWRDLSKELHAYPNHLLAYELMNEAVADNHESWNELLTKAISVIRELEPNRTIVVGSNRWQSVDTFDALEIPENDKNILLSFHFYKPFLLSHYAAEWTYLKSYAGPVHYPGTILTNQEFEKIPENIKEEIQPWVNLEFNKDVLLQKWQKPIQKAKDLGLSLYCGEFGIISKAPQKQRMLWYKDMIALFEQTGIAYANWNYKSDDFGLYKSDMTKNNELIDIISNGGITTK